MRTSKSHLRLPSCDIDLFLSSIHSQAPVSGLTHDFYKYPARFSPDFVRTAIEVFTNPGDLVVDPFVGGGTSLVEARASGRIGIGTDLSPLAVFVTETKAQPMRACDYAAIRSWFSSLPDHLNLRNKLEDADWGRLGYFRNIRCPQTWPIKKTIELALLQTEKISSNRQRAFARCVLLRSAQWALDGRKKFPGASRFRKRIILNSKLMVDAGEKYSRRVRKADSLAPNAGKHRTVCRQCRAQDLPKIFRALNRKCPSLILMSPPYPGVHVLYHRWQLRGGRETPAPFWIANRLDGAGTAFYTMNARASSLDRYFEGIRNSYAGLAKIVSPNTTLVQMVAFSNPRDQLPRYLSVIESCGFEEQLLSEHLDSTDGRIWRSVPSRKWHANIKGNLPSAREVVLIHKPS